MRAENRHNLSRVYTRRVKLRKVFDAIPDNVYCFKSTGRPCSCWLCKRPRYKRAEEKSQLIKDELLGILA